MLEFSKSFAAQFDCVKSHSVVVLLASVPEPGTSCNQCAVPMKIYQLMFGAMASPKKRKSEHSHEWEVQAKHELAVWRWWFCKTKSLVHAHWRCSAEGGGSALYQKPVEFQTYSCRRWEEIWGLGKVGVGQLEDLVYSYFLLEDVKWSGIRVSEIAKDPIQLYMESAQAKGDKATVVDLPCLTCCSIMNLEDGRKKTWATRLVQNKRRVGPLGRTDWTTVRRQQWTAPAAQNCLMDSDFILQLIYCGVWNFSTACIQNQGAPSRSKHATFFIVTNHCSLFGLLTFNVSKVKEITVAYLQ